MSRISRSTDIKSALRSRQRGFIMNPYQYAAAGNFPSSGLVSYYKLDANSLDSLGVNNGSDSSMSYSAAGIVGNGATFASGQISLTAGAPPTNTSVSLWFKRSALGTAEQLLYGWYALDSIVYWRISINLFGAGRAAMIMRSATNDFKLWDIAQAVTDTTTFHHLVVTQAGVAAPAIYLDGVSRTVTQQNTSGTVVKWTGTVPHSMGKSSNVTFPLTYAGMIDEVGLWNRVITAAEVTTLYNSGLGITYP